MFETLVMMTRAETRRKLWMEIWQVEKVIYLCEFCQFGPLGLGGKLGWNFWIRVIRLEPRRKPKMEIVPDCGSQGAMEYRIAILFIFLR